MKRDEPNDKLELQSYFNTLRGYIDQLEQTDTATNVEKIGGAEQIFISMFDNADDGIAVADVESKEIFIANKSICKMLGYSQEEFANINLKEFHPPDKLPYVMEQFEKQARRELVLARNVPLKRKDGSVLYADINSFPVLLNRKKYLIGFFRDVSNLRQAEEALMQSEEKFRLAMEVTNDALWDWNLVTNEVYRNPRNATMLGYEPHEFTSSHEEWEERIHPDDRKLLHDILNEHFEGKRDSYECEYRLRTKSDEYIWVLGRGKVVERNESGLPVRMIGINIDITKRKQVEQSLSESEKHYRMLAETINDGLSHINENGIKVYVNRKCAEILGYSPDEMIGRHWLDFYDEDVRKTLQDQWAKRKMGFSEPYEIENTRKDGRRIYLHISPRPVFDESGTFRGSVAILTDITERKRMEEALRRSEEKFRLAMEVSNDALWDWDLRTNKVYRNPRYATMLGYGPDELSSSQEEWEKRVHPDDKATVFEVLNETLSGKKDSFKLEYRLGTKSDDYIWVLGRAKVVEYDDDGSPVRMIGTNSDITERKKSEEALRESEETLKSLINSITEPVMLLDTQGTIHTLNESCARTLGGSIDELMGMCAYDYQSNDDIREHRRSKLTEVVRTGRPVRFEDNPPGRVVQCSLYPVFDAAGNVVRIAVFGLDVTERKHIEQTLRESEEKYRTLVESTDEGIASLNERGEFLFINNAGAKRLGCKPKDCVGKTMLDFFPKEIADRQLADLQKVFRTGQSLSQVNLTCIQGKPRWYDINIEPLKDGRGNVTASLVIAHDIHEFKQAEEQISKLSSAVEQSIDGIIMCDLDKNILYVNNAYAAMHGYTQEEMTTVTLDDLRSNESVISIKEIAQQVEDTGAWTGEVEHFRKDGSTFPVYLSITQLKDNNREPIGSIAICRDMTEHKKTREDLMTKDAAIASSITGITIGDAEGGLTYANNSFLEMWGYENLSEIQGKKAEDFLRKEDALMVMQSLRDSGGWIGELTARRKDGLEFNVQACVSLITNSDGYPIATMGSCVDITESKKNQERLSAYKEKIARTEQLASLGTLSATVAHELTQPLTVIRLSLESALSKIQKKSPDDPCVKKIEDSLNQVSNIVTITQQFRNFARRSSDSHTSEINLRSVAVRLAGFLAESAGRANIAVCIKDMENLPVIYCNENEIEQMFFALISNAIQAADGSWLRSLTISGNVKDGHIELRFTDNCGGIAPENIDRIFEPFFTTKPIGKGTGLGLCIVQDIMYRTGGKIRVESEYGEGATFIVTLPVMDSYS